MHEEVRLSTPKKFNGDSTIIDNRPKGDMDPIWCICCWWCSLDYTEEEWNWAKVSEVHSFPYMTMTYGDYYSSTNSIEWSFQWEAKESWDGGSFGSSGSVTIKYTYTSSTDHTLTLSNGEDQNIYQQFKFRHEHWHCYGLLGDLWHEVDDVYVVDFKPASFDHRAENPPGDQDPNFWNKGWLGSQVTYAGGHQTWVENTVSTSLSASSSITAGIVTVTLTDTLELSKSIRYDMNFQSGHIWDIYTDNKFIVYGYYHNDAGKGRDAPDNFNDAITISDGSWGNNYLGGWDTEDWYKFYVSSGYNIYITMTPYSADFDLELRNPSGTWKAGSYYGWGSTDSISYKAGSSGYWRIRVYVYNGLGEYSLSLSTWYSGGGGGGGGCPYVSTWDGNQYVLDNNLLMAAWHSGGTDVTDYYLLQQTLTQRTDGTYSLMLSEFESEHDFLDSAQLIAVDHDADVNVAVSPRGEILTYTNPSPPVAAIDNNNRNLKSLLGSIDENYYESHNGSYVVLNFGDELDVSQGAKLVMRTDYYKYSIHIQVQDESNNWNTVATVIPRRYWSTEIIDMSKHLPDAKGNLEVRLYFTANHRIDFVGLDTSPQSTVHIQEGQFISAIHSVDGNVTAKLLYNDETYAELVPEQQIDLQFEIPQIAADVRDFIVIVHGHYINLPS